MGCITFGEGAILRGRDIFEEFGSHQWMEFMVFAATGKDSPKIARLLDALWIICTSYPDPRLWNNRVSALAGTARSTGVLAIAAGISVSEATIYGLRPIQGATDLLYRFKKKLDEGHELKNLIKTELKNHRAVFGYGRPLASGDERISPLMDFARSINADKGTYIKLAFEISDFFKKSRYKYQMNIAAVAAGLVADHGVTAKEFYYLATLCFTGGMFPCYVDAINHQEGTLFPLSTKRIKYTGTHTNRNWHAKGGQ
jgi:citrate synthase